MRRTGVETSGARPGERAETQSRQGQGVFGNGQERGRFDKCLFGIEHVTRWPGAAQRERARHEWHTAWQSRKFHKIIAIIMESHSIKTTKISEGNIL